MKKILFTVLFLVFVNILLSAQQIQLLTPPHGYRSCVIYVNKKTLLACACDTSGIDISEDGGMNWQLISNESFHAVQKIKNGSAVFLAGMNGIIAKIIFD